MKKISYVLVLVLIVLTGCGSSISTSTDVNDEKDIVLGEFENEEVKNNEDELADDDSGIFSSIPDWLENLSTLKNDDKKLFFKGNGNDFSIEKNKITIPDSNIILLAKEIAGHDIEGIEIQNDIIDILNAIENSEPIDEQEIKNQEWLGLKYYVVFLSTDAKYYLMDIDMSVKDIAHVTITGDDEYQSFFIKSNSLCECIKNNAQYKLFDVKNAFQISRIDLVKKEEKYKLSESELKKFKNIILSLNIKANSCKGPFDVDFRAEFNKETIYIKWCNDDCRIIAVEGGYYYVSDSDAKWIQEIVKRE